MILPWQNGPDECRNRANLVWNMNTKRDEVTIYEPEQRLKMGMFRIWLVMFRNIAGSRELICQLFKRDFLAQYKKSFLGVTWLLIAPVVTIIQWVFLNKAGILNMGDIAISKPVYLLVGNIMWMLFIGFYGHAAGTLKAGQSFILQVKFPHEVLLIKQTAQQLANSLLGIALVLAVMPLFNVNPSWMTLTLPLVIIPLFFLGAGIGLVVSLISVVALDISKVMGTFLGLAMFVTPILYSNRFDNPVLQSVIRWNPLTYLVCGARDIVLYGRIDNMPAFLVASGLAMVVFMISWRFFFIAEHKVVEKIG